MAEPAMAQQLILIDAYSQIFRGFYAIARLTNRRGEPVNALFAMARLLLKLHEEYPSSHGAAVFDCGKVQFRQALNPDYKANRAPMPEELAAQIPQLRELFEAFGWPLLEEPEYEADDLIAALAHGAALEVRIISSDKDLAQLIDDRVAMLVPAAKGGFELRDAAAVAAKFGVGPAGIVDYLSLIGDASDNIPGLRGVGPKTAVKLLTETGGLERMLAEPERIPEKWRQAVLDHRELLDRNRQLIRLRLDLPARIAAPPERRTPDWRRALELCRAQELHAVVRDLEQYAGAPVWVQDELF